MRRIVPKAIRMQFVSIDMANAMEAAHISEKHGAQTRSTNEYTYKGWAVGVYFR